MITPLKPRHVEVLSGLQRGDSNKVIARRLNLTEATIKLYVRQLMKIFDAKNRTALALKAATHPQLHPTPEPHPGTVGTTTAGAVGAVGAATPDMPDTPDATGSSPRKGSRWVSMADAGRGEIVTRHSQFKAHQYLLRRERESRQPPIQETS